jgi:hypothetical protein
MTYTFHYGAFAHPSCEVYPRRVEITPVRSRDNAKWGMLHRLEVAGDLVGVNTPAEVVAAIAALDAAYAEDFKDVGFKLNNVWTPHKMLTDDTLNLSGNRVVYRSWDNALPTELANTRSFSIGIEALYATITSGIIEFRETTTKIGTGDPEWKLYDIAAGDPVIEPVKAKTKVRHVQSGTYTSIQPWISPPDPYWPLEELKKQRVIRYSNPIVHGHPSGKFTHYTVDYTYVFERLGPSAVLPNPFWVP